MVSLEDYGLDDTLFIILACTLIFVPVAIRLRLQLLAEWTETLKRIGHRMICFLLLVFNSDYDDDKIKTMTSIDLDEKEELMDIMKYLEETLGVHWTDHEGYSVLQERLLAVRMIMDDKKNMKNC